MESNEKALQQALKDNPIEASLQLLTDLMNENTPKASHEDMKQLMAVQAVFLHSVGVGLMSTSTKGKKIDRGKIQLAFKAFGLSRSAGEVFSKR